MTATQTIKERLRYFISYKRIGQGKFEKKCGLSNGYVNNISKGIGAEKLQNILNAYPELNQSWLLTGEGSMLRGDVATRTCQNGCGTSVTATNNSQAAGGNIVTHLAPNGEDGARAFLEEIAAHRRMVEKAQEQTDRLLTIIERLTGGEKTI